MTGIVDRFKLTDVWKDSEITKNYEYGILTNEIYKSCSGMKANEYKAYKGLRKESLRDNMTDIEIVLTELGVVATRELVKEYKPYGLNQNKEIVKMDGSAAKSARDNIEENLRKKVVSKDNSLNYKYLEEVKIIENK